MFSDATLWNGGTLMDGTRQPLRVSRTAFDRKCRDTGTAIALKAIGLTSYDALIGSYSGDARAMRAFVGHGPLLTDDHPRLEYHRSLARGDALEDLGQFRGDRWDLVEAP